MPIEILLVDDHKVLRQGLCALLENEADLHVVGEAADGQTAMRLAQERTPDVVVLDISLPDIGGIAVTRQLISKNPALKIVVLSMHIEARIVSEVLDAGALAYVLKCVAFEDLIRAIRAVLKGQMYLSPGITKTVIDDYRRLLDNGSVNERGSLTAREREVAELIARGRSTVEIGDMLNISPKTVASHRKNLMDKLGLSSVAELTVFALKEGLITNE